MICKTKASTVHYLLSRRAFRSLERENDKKGVKTHPSEPTKSILCTAVYFKLTFSAKPLL